MSTKQVYLDNAASTPVDKRVLKEILPFFGEKYGNASSVHSSGREGMEAIQKAREKIAKAINAEPEEIIFTSSGTESNNLLIKGFARAGLEKEKHILTQKTEHDAVLHPIEELAKQGFETRVLEVDREGFFQMEEFEKEAGRAGLASIMHANNEIGTIYPIKKIGKICREKGTVFHTDAVQTVGKEKINVKKMKIDALSASAHKFYGPKGAGFLYLKEGIKIEGLMSGGGQERKLRPGTYNTQGIVGMGKALEIANKEMNNAKEKEKKMQKELAKRLMEIDDSWINGPKIGSKRLANNLSAGFEYVEGEAMLIKLDDYGIAASTGSACSSDSLKASHVLLGIGLRPRRAHGTLRFSLGKQNNIQDVKYVGEKMKKVVGELRNISPLKKGVIK